MRPSPRPLRNLPPEACKRVAVHLSSHSLKKLCGTSKAAYKFFNQILYESISTPGSLAQTGKLLATLAQPRERRRALGPHPASLVRHVDIDFIIPSARHETREETKKKLETAMKIASRLLLSALNNTATVSAGRSNIRAFRWFSNVAIDDLGKLLSQRGLFPHLKELAVCPHYHGLNRASFQFLTVPGLTCIEYAEEIWEYGVKEPVAYNAFSFALLAIPAASPNLHTLRLDFQLHGQRQDLDTLVSKFNCLRFPALRVVAIKLDVSEFNRSSPDFHPFINAHLSLEDVSIDLAGKPLAHAALPHLQSFSGRPLDCITVCDGARPIDSLTLSLRPPRFNLSVHNADKGVWDCKTVLKHLASAQLLRRLYLKASPPDDEDPHYERQGLCSSIIREISEACPNLTHLELHVSHGIWNCHEALVEFRHLKWLKLNVWDEIRPRSLYQRTINMFMLELADIDPELGLEDIPRAASEVFPADKLAKDIERHFAVKLKDLHTVELDLAGEDSSPSEFRDYRGPEYEIKYTFKIGREGDTVFVNLVETQEC